MSRIGLAIGCGGTIGGAWATAALAALAGELDWDPRTATILQGTSAGAQIVTQLAGGYSVSDLAAMHRGLPVDAVLWRHLNATPRSVPPLPTPVLTCRRTLALRGTGGHAAVSGLAPRGRADAGFLTALADGVADPRGWLPHPGARLVAFEPATGLRVAFGGPAAPHATIDEALRASWAVPGWMPPVTIDGRTYIDGGAASTASVDLIDPAALDILYVIAPMASPPDVRAPGPGGRAEQILLRRPMSRVLDREVTTARANGLRVVTILPDNDDMAALGWNFMSRSHRAHAFARATTTAQATVVRALHDQEVPA